jgi:hypothetical protein
MHVWLPSMVSPDKQREILRQQEAPVFEETLCLSSKLRAATVIGRLERFSS